MSAVYLIDPTDILYCIDTYEDTYEGPLGALDQYDQSGQRTTATSQSLAGVEPGTAISYDQAVATCANTPVTSSDGTVLGYKRLATSQEWIDAGDGQPGTGGSRYIYGSNFNASRCATLNSQGGQQYPTTQLTGSLPGCVSRFGVFDQSGNAWEWTNPQMNISISDWFTLANENSLEMRVDEGGLIVSDSMTVAPVLTFDMAGVSPSTVSQDSEGYLFINSNQVNPGSIDFKGYLKMSLAAVPYNGEDNFLPVKLSSIDPADPTAPFRVLLLVDDDGAPIPDKRGAAYYAGNSDDCSNYSAHYNHFHDFNGTISFRCVSAPILDFPVP